MKLNLLLITLPYLLLFSEKPQVCGNKNIYELEMSTKDTVSISIIGDVMMHTRQLDFDYTHYLDNIQGNLKKADIAIANMEFSLSGKPYTGYPSFSAPDGYASYIRDCGVDVFLTANNHILDKGRDGALRTMQVYDTTANVKWTGAYRSAKEKEERNPLIVKCKGIKFALLNFSYGTNCHNWQDAAIMMMNKAEIHSAIERAKAVKADFIIALPHWGTEYQTTHSKEQEEWANWLVREGVDVIVGSHPHVIQDTCHICGVPVIYSIGNAISNMSAQNTQLEYYTTLRFTNDWKNGEKRLLEPELKYMWCSLPGGFSDNYSTFFVEDWIGQRNRWKDPSDHDKMMNTLSGKLSLCR